jgi:hypothetical protein
MLDLSLAFDLLVAALVGLAVGVQREWTGHTDGPDGRFAGARTFALLGIIGGFAGWLVRLGYPALATVIAAGGVLMPIVAYWATMRRPGTTTDGTTEVVAVLVVALGLTAGLGVRTPAAAVGVDDHRRCRARLAGAELPRSGERGVVGSLRRDEPALELGRIGDADTGLHNVDQPSAVADAEPAGIDRLQHR